MMRPGLHLLNRGGAAHPTASTGNNFGARMRPALRPVHTERIVRIVTQAWGWLANRRKAQLESRHLRVIETVQLGEKRFVTLLEVDGARLLIGGAAGQLSLLIRLESGPPGKPTGETIAAQADQA